MLVSDIRIGPESFAKHISGYNITSPVQQHLQDLEGLFLQPDTHSMLAKFARLEVDFKGAETRYDA